MKLILLSILLVISNTIEAQQDYNNVKTIFLKDSLDTVIVSKIDSCEKKNRTHLFNNYPKEASVKGDTICYFNFVKRRGIVIEYVIILGKDSVETFGNTSMYRKQNINDLKVSIQNVLLSLDTTSFYQIPKKVADKEYLIENYTPAYEIISVNGIVKMAILGNDNIYFLDKNSILYHIRNFISFSSLLPSLYPHRIFIKK